MQEITWLVNILEEHNLPQKQPITIYEYNIPCIKMTKLDMYSSITKHIDVKYHFIKHMKENGTTELCCCPKKLMIVDILTKP